MWLALDTAGIAPRLLWENRALARRQGENLPGARRHAAALLPIVQRLLGRRDPLWTRFKAWC